MVRTIVGVCLAFAVATSAYGILGLSRVIPEELKDTDIDLMKENARYLLEGKPEGSELTWSNPKTSNSGRVTLKKSFILKNQQCRVVEHDVFLEGDADNFSYVSTICRDANGKWINLP